MLAPLTPPRSVARKAQQRWAEACLGCVLLAILVINLPAFLCLGLDPDVMQWDLGARTVLQGGTPYRDWVENNLPGMLWLHVFIHSLLGWRSEVFRAVDLLIVLTLIAQLTRWLPVSASRPLRLAVAGILLIFYLSTSEWCHGQRDVWMLLPALLALSLRLRQTARLHSPDPVWSRIVEAGLIEGLLWGCAFWIKPFVIVPAFLCWLLSARLNGQASGSRRKLVLDGIAILCGGLLCGAAGVGWLLATGAWPAFAEILFVWNREYVVTDQTGGNRWLGLAGLLIRLFPWIFIHLFAVPVAIGQTRKALRSSWHPENLAPSLLAMLYLGWLLQACFLQHVFDYVQVPCVFIGLTVVACRYAACGQPSTRRLLLALVLAFVLARFPALCQERLHVWERCLQEGSTAALRDRLTLFPKTQWSELDEVAAFLRRQDIGDGELSCMHMTSIALYQQMDVKPATRFPFLQNMLMNFTRQRETIFAALAGSRQRFLICDLEGHGMESVRLAREQTDEIVFRSGRYVVFRLSGAETRRWFEETLGERASACQETDSGR